MPSVSRGRSPSAHPDKTFNFVGVASQAALPSCSACVRATRLEEESRMLETKTQMGVLPVCLGQPTHNVINDPYQIHFPNPNKVQALL